MINDPIAKNEILENWKGVNKLKNSFHIVHLYPGAGLIGNSTPQEFYNLPFILAYTVLDGVLEQLKNEGVFSCNTWMLGVKMEKSRDKIPWNNYDLINSGKNARNDLAHKAITINKTDCLKYIEAIETELKAWGIL